MRKLSLIASLSACLLFACGLVLYFFFGSMVSSVKNATPLDYPNVTYGEAFGEYFHNPQWRHFKSDTGKDIVEFTGNCLFQDAEVEATIQFLLNTDTGTTEIAFLALNDIPQNKLYLSALLSKVFQPYASSAPEDVPPVSINEPAVQEPVIVPSTQENLPEALPSEQKANDPIVFPNMAPDSMLNIRSGPSQNCQVVEQVNSQATLKLLAQEGDWYYICTESGTYGYVVAQYITINKINMPTYNTATDPQYSDAPEGSAKADSYDEDLGLDAHGNSIEMGDQVIATDTLGYCLEGTVVDLSEDKQVLVHWDNAYDQAHDPYGVIEPNDFVDWAVVNRYIGQEIWYETATLIDVVGRS